MQVGIPFALKLFSRQSQALVGSFHLPEGGTGENNAEERGDDSRDHGDVTHQRAPREAERIHHLQGVHESVTPGAALGGEATDADECIEAWLAAPDAVGDGTVRRGVSGL